ncbi:MAG: peptidoglycan bridge formation glycyltransferase FemA/FemB family protein [bacterium]
MINENKTKWNEFVVKNNGSFLQSYEWGEFQKSLGRKIWRIEIDGLKALIIRHNLPLGRNYLYCPRPVILSEAKNLVEIEKFVNKVKIIAREEKSIFFKVEPKDNVDYSEFGFNKSQKELQPSKTLILDLSKTERELLSQMHQKTRYNIKLAKRKGVTFEETKDHEFIGIFLKLLEKTSKRDNFYTHSKDYYKKMVDVLDDNDMLKIYVTICKEKAITTNLVIYFGDTATYLHGASDHEYRQVMAPSLLQWQTILRAKERGYKYYNFWGIDENKWPGVTRFKRGFGGKEVIYSGAYDLVFKKSWYKAYNVARKFKIKLTNLVK